jgi:hypothetical protein
MAAEFYVRFENPDWYSKNRSWLGASVETLPTFVGKQDAIYSLKGSEGIEEPHRWSYDVRIFLKDGPPMLLEISAHPPSIERDLTALLSSLRRQTAIVVVDEDGEPSDW